MRFLGLVETECCPFHKFAGEQTLTLGTDSNKRGNGKLPLAAAQARGPGQIHAVNAGRSPETFELCRAAGRQRGATDRA
jgi:hypothetical protein